MNLKKFISGVSALAIAASAFAGLAVTASAAGYERTLTSNFTLSGYTNGTLYDFQNNDPAVLTEGSSNLAYRSGGNWGLHNFASGGRSATVSIPVTSGGILVMQPYTNTEPTIDVGTLNSTLTASTGYRVFDINSDSSSVTFTCPRYAGVVAVMTMDKDTAAASANYTVKYVDSNGVAVKDADTISGTVGTAPAFDKSSFTANGQKYIYVSDDSEGKTIAADGSTVVNVTFRAATKYTGTVNAVVDGIADPIKTYTNSAWDDESFTIYYEKYIEYNGKYYETTAKGSEPYYGEKFTAVDSRNITYTEADVDYAVEGENISGVDPSYSNIRDRFAGGNGGRIQTSSIDIDWTAPVDSEVTLTVNAFERSNSGDGISLPVQLIDGESNATETGETLTWGRMNSGDKTATVTVPAGSKIRLYWEQTYRTNLYVDYLSIKATPITVPEANLGAAITEQGTENGTEDFADEAATWFIITVANTGDAAGAFNTVSITDGTKTGTYSAPNTTINAGAEIVYGGVVEGAYTFTSASVD